MANATTIVEDSLALNGVENPTANQKSQGFRFLNDLISSESIKRLFTHVNVEDTHTLVDGTASYTIGSGATISTVRPIKIVDVQVRDSNSQDYPVDIITEPEYKFFTKKSIEGRPDKLYYDTTYPNGTIYLYPTPNAAETLVLTSWKAITELSTLDSTVTLPNEYKSVLKWGLAASLAPIYDEGLLQYFEGKAQKAYLELGDANAKYMVAQFPNALVGRRFNNIETGVQ
jgi:hypothetical protein